MSKVFKLFVILLILLPFALISCSDSSSVIDNKMNKNNAAGTAGGTAGTALEYKKYNGPLVDVRFVSDCGEDGSKSLLPEFVGDEDPSVESLFWKYTAVFSSDTTIPGNTGDTETTLTDYNVPGLQQTASGFAPGKWTFQLFGYADKEYTIIKYKSPETVFVLVSTSGTNLVPFEVAKVQDASRGNGSIVVDVENITFSDPLSGVCLTATDKVEIYYFSDSNQIDIDPDVDGKYIADDVTPGSHEVVIKFSDEGVYYAQVSKVEVYSNFSTKLTGEMSRQKLKTYTNYFVDLDPVYTSDTWVNRTSFTDDPDVYTHKYTWTEEILKPVKENFSFVGWTTYSDYDDATSLTHIPARAYESMTLKAKFVPVRYKIVYDMNAYLYNSADVDTSVKTPTNMIESYDYTSETFLLTTETTRVGYKFNTWTSGTSVNDETSSSNYAVPKNTSGDLNFIASWTPNKYFVKFTTGTGGGGSTIAAGTMENQEFAYDTEGHLSSSLFEKDGYTFKHWKMAGKTTTFTDGGSVLNLTSQSDGVVELEAVWTSNTYHIEYMPNGTSPTDGAELAFTAPEEISDVKTADYIFDKEDELLDSMYKRVGYKFAGWTTDSDNLGTLYLTETNYKNFTTEADATVKLYAKWEPVTYKITIIADPELDGDQYGDGSDVVTTVAFGKTSVTEFDAPAAANGELLGYFTTISDTAVKVLSTNSNVLIANVDGITNEYGQWTTATDVTLFAMWASTGEIEVEAGSSDVIYVLNDSTVTSETSNGVTTRTSCHITESVSINGVIEKNTGDVDISDFESDRYMILVSTSWYEDVAGLNMQRTLNEYYKAVLEGFYTDAERTIKVINGDGSFVDNADGYTSDGKWVCSEANVKLYAKWDKGEKLSFRLNYKSNGSYPADAITALADKTYVDSLIKTGNVTLESSIFAREGYKLDSWNTKADGSGDSYSINTVHNGSEFELVDDCATLYAQWVPVTYRITIKANPNLGGDTYGDGSDAETTVKFGDKTVASFSSPTSAHGVLLGYFNSVLEDAIMVLPADSNELVPDLTGITNESGQWITATNMTLYAKWAVEEVISVHGFTDVRYDLNYLVATSETSNGVTTKTSFYVGQTVAFTDGIAMYAQSVDLSDIKNLGCKVVVITSWFEKVGEYNTEKTLDEYYKADLEGFYTDAECSSVNKLINSNGSFVASVSGYTDEDGKWICESPTLTLYANWTRGDKINN